MPKIGGKPTKIGQLTGGQNSTPNNGAGGLPGPAGLQGTGLAAKLEGVQLVAERVPKMVRPFTCHGIDMDWQRGGDQAKGQCPFCDREGKFWVNVITGQWDCKVCFKKGNVVEFLRQFWELCSDETKTEDLDELAASRKLLDPMTLTHWGVVKSRITGEWLVPGYSLEGKLSNLYRYVKTPDGMRLYSTTEVVHHLHGAHLFSASKPNTFICEGPWDAMALWELLRLIKHSVDKGLAITGSEKASLYNDSNVLAVPGAGVFREEWLPLFAGDSCQRLTLCYDSDFPRINKQTNQPMAPVGLGAMKRVVEILGRAENPPKEIHYLNWGPEGYAKDLPDGWDVRDTLSQKEATTPEDRIPNLKQLLGLMHPIPADWLAGRSASTIKKGGADLECLPCSSWKELVNELRKAMKWTDGMEDTLAAMFACIGSTKVPGDQVWLKVIGPPSCGKSVLCEALSVASKYIVAKSTIRGFHSGFKSDRDGTEDNSLLNKLWGKTLVTKDGDTLLASPNREQILSEARDIFDTTSRSHYRNKMGKDYTGLRMTWILCGTQSLRALDDSELGERFLDIVLVENMEEDLENEIGWRAINRAFQDMDTPLDDTPETRENSDMTRAKQLTGGYVVHLRENISKLITAVKCSDHNLRRIQRLGEFVSFLRSRPSSRQEEQVERELPFRLQIQLTRMARCLAVVLNRKEVDERVMRVVTKIATDTARGRSLKIAKLLYDAGRKGLPRPSIGIHMSQSDEKIGSYLSFLKKLKVVELLQRKEKFGLSSKPRWILSERLRLLYKEVYNAEDPAEDDDPE